MEKIKVYPSEERVPDDRNTLTQKILHLYNLKAGDKFDTKKKKIIHSIWDHLVRYASDNDDRNDLVLYIQNIVYDLLQKERDPEIEDLKDKLLEIIIILKQTYRKDSYIKSCLEAEIIKLKKFQG